VEDVMGGNPLADASLRFDDVQARPILAANVEQMQGT
jgi:hypothetical protein